MVLYAQQKTHELALAGYPNDGHSFTTNKCYKVLEDLIHHFLGFQPDGLGGNQLYGDLYAYCPSKFFSGHSKRVVPPTLYEYVVYRFRAFAQRTIRGPCNEYSFLVPPRFHRKRGQYQFNETRFDACSKNWWRGPSAKRERYRDTKKSVSRKSQNNFFRVTLLTYGIEKATPKKTKFTVPYKNVLIMKEHARGTRPRSPVSKWIIGFKRRLAKKGISLIPENPVQQTNALILTYQISPFKNGCAISCFRIHTSK